MLIIYVTVLNDQDRDTNRHTTTALRLTQLSPVFAPSVLFLFQDPIQYFPLHSLVFFLSLGPLAKIKCSVPSSL